MASTHFHLRPKGGWSTAIFDFDPFDMDFDGDVDGIDFLGFDYLIGHVFGRKEGKDDEELGPDDEGTGNGDDYDY